jgi:hypothetical protein
MVQLMVISAPDTVVFCEPAPHHAAAAAAAAAATAAAAAAALAVCSYSLCLGGFVCVTVKF